MNEARRSELEFEGELDGARATDLVEAAVGAASPQKAR
jgi:hypothetical protein